MTDINTCTDCKYNQYPAYSTNETTNSVSNQAEQKSSLCGRAVKWIKNFAHKHENKLMLIASIIIGLAIVAFYTFCVPPVITLITAVAVAGIGTAFWLLTRD